MWSTASCLKSTRQGIFWNSEFFRFKNDNTGYKHYIANPARYGPAFHNQIQPHSGKTTSEDVLNGIKTIMSPTSV